jgi:hypothetical protein
MAIYALQPNISIENSVSCHIELFYFFYWTIFVTLQFPLFSFDSLPKLLLFQAFRTGDVINVFGDMDDDGFYLAELRNQRGLVPSNFLTEAPNQDIGGRRGLGASGASGPPPPPRGGLAGKKGATKSWTMFWNKP